MDIIVEKAMVTVEGKAVECKVVLARIAGGKQIQYIGTDGTVLKKEKLSTSPYRFLAAPDKYKK